MNKCYVYILIHFEIAYIDEVFKAASEMRFSAKDR